MRLPFTDKFLWDLYKLLEGLYKGVEFLNVRTMKEAVYPEWRNLRNKYAREKRKKYFGQFVHYLKKQEYVKIKNLQSSEGIMLTKKGIQRALQTQCRLTKRIKRNDAQWQMLIFDIPERKRLLRTILRQNLLRLGYQMLQQSVWVCPYDVYQETEKLLMVYELDPYVRLFLIKEIEM